MFFVGFKNLEEFPLCLPAHLGIPAARVRITITNTGSADPRPRDDPTEVLVELPGARSSLNVELMSGGLNTGAIEALFVFMRRVKSCS